MVKRSKNVNNSNKKILKNNKRTNKKEIRKNKKIVNFVDKNNSKENLKKAMEENQINWIAYFLMKKIK